MPIGTKKEVTLEVASEIVKNWNKLFQDEMLITNYTVSQADTDNIFATIKENGTFLKVMNIRLSNPTYFYNKPAFSCMNFYEFASDAWLTLFYEYHFRGFFLGKIPLMKRLNRRECRQSLSPILKQELELKTFSGFFVLMLYGD